MVTMYVDQQTAVENGPTSRRIPRLASKSLRQTVKKFEMLMMSRRLSVPKTKYTDIKADNLPKRAIDNIKLLLGDLFPDLAVPYLTLA